jgi:hypothetical protein
MLNSWFHFNARESRAPILYFLHLSPHAQINCPKGKHMHFTVLSPVGIKMNTTGLHTSQNMVSFLLGFVSMHAYSRVSATNIQPAKIPCDLH